MDWLQVLFLFVANAALIAWFRAESRADWRMMDAKMSSWQDRMYQETKEFHGRLCAIEERRTKQEIT